MSSAVQNSTDPRSENRVVGSSLPVAACTWSFGLDHVDLHQDTFDTSAKTVSGASCWLSKDPIGISGGLNQYVYCANNPINFIDPFGLRLTAGEIANIVFNETRSLSGAGIDDARQNMIFAIINGDENEELTGQKRPKSAPKTACVPEEEQSTYDDIVDQVLQALSDYYEEGIDPTAGARHFNQRPNGSTRPLFNTYPIHTHVGPLDNSYPTPELPAHGIYGNTYE